MQQGLAQDAMFIATSGNVGIGTSSPTNKLSVEGNANFTGNVGIGTASSASKLSVEGNANFTGNTSFTGNANFTGDVGIGTISPTQAKLVVNGWFSTKVPSIKYYGLYSSGDGVESDQQISIYASRPILAKEFYAFSDSRIKTDFNRSNIAADLATLKQIQVTDYRYKDPFQYGNEVKKGIIAQEVEAVFPQAVNKHTDYITDIFAMPKEVSLDEKTLKVSMEKAHGLANGDMLRLITPTEVVETAVEVLDNNTFIVKDWAKDSKEVFVYGKKVDDFRAVDFDRLTILSISSIQQLCKEMEVMKNELSTCQKALLTLKDLEARVGKMEISAKPATATIE